MRLLELLLLLGHLVGSGVLARVQLDLLLEQSRGQGHHYLVRCREEASVVRLLLGQLGGILLLLLLQFLAQT